jgi:drug/metabolite transporter (DMT)-like permease
MWSVLLAAVFLGTFLAIFLQQVALRYAETGIAQTLLMTSHLFILPIAGLAGERVTIRAIIGALIASVGIIILFGL